MFTQRPARILVATSCLAAVALAGCASAGQPTWTERPLAATTPASAASGSTPVAAVPASGVAQARTSSMARGSGSAAVMHMSDRAVPAPTPDPSAPAAPAVGSPVHVDLAIVTGDMIGKTEYPAFIPSDIVLPANATVVVTITNFDDATPLPKGSEAYARAQGIVGGTFTVTPIDPKNPNGSAGSTRTLASLDPNDVSHTLTVAGLGLNVPIAPHARVTFTVHTGAPGRYTWHCYDPCGAGATGWGTAMSAMRGYMEGTFTVA